MSNLKRVQQLQYLPVSLDKVRLYVPPKEIVEPAKNLISDSRAAWLRVFANSDTIKGLFEKYVFFLAAIPDKCSLEGQGSSRASLPQLSLTCLA